MHDAERTTTRPYWLVDDIEASVARTDGGGLLGVRAPMHDAERTTTRPYWLVDDIEASVERAVAEGAEVMHPPMEIEGFGSFAIFSLGGVEHALWQL